MTRIIPVVTAVAAVLCCETSPALAQSYGNSPWCAVVNQGGGDVVWECQYASAAQCAPAITGGNRGFCAINPSFVPQGAPRRRNW